MSSLRQQLRLDRFYTVAAITVVSILTALRQPDLVMDPRFWAEEATIYFKYAFQNGPLHTLIAPQLGYFSLIANIGGVTASFMRIPDAPYATLVLSFVIQISPFIILALSDAPYLKTASLRAFSILFLFLVMIGSETWLNSVNSQFVMLTAGGLILSSRPIDSRSSCIRCFFLLLLGLSGPGSIAFIPLFWLAAWQDGSRSRRHEALAITFSGFVQICFLILAPKLIVRQFSFPLSSVLAWYVAGVEGKLLGGQQISAWLFGKLFGFSKQHPIIFTSLTLATQLPVIFYFYWISSVEGKRLILSSLAVAAVSAFGSIVLGPERYALAPAALLGMAVLNSFLSNPGDGFWKICLGIAISCSIMMGAYDYFWARSYNGPSWRQQVTDSQWTTSKPVKIWPDTWKVELTK